MRVKRVLQSIIIAVLVSFVLSWFLLFLSIVVKEIMNDNILNFIQFIVFPLIGILMGYFFYIKDKGSKFKYMFIFSIVYFIFVYILCFFASFVAVLFLIGPPPS